MTEPAFVIHGVGNHGRDEVVRGLVAGLADTTGLPMHPVYWGDLAADPERISSAIPSSREDPAVRVDERPGDPVDIALLGAWLPSVPVATRTRGSDAEVTQLDAIATGVRAVLAATGAMVEPFLSAHLREIIDAVGADWHHNRWLPEIWDGELLTELGSTLAGMIANGNDAADVDDVLVRRAMTRLDRVVGATVRATGGRLHTYLRAQLFPGLARFLGDLLAYQSRRTEIHQRVLATVRAVDPAFGGPTRPIRLVAHSLGGVIAMDMALADDPLWIDSLVTFGCQWPLFGLANSRQDNVLPCSLGRWTNVWEPLDPLAFVAAAAYRMHDGTAPVDVEIRHIGSSGPWTHSVYWSAHDLARVIGDVFGSPGSAHHGQG